MRPGRLRLVLVLVGLNLLAIAAFAQLTLLEEAAPRQSATARLQIDAPGDEPLLNVSVQVGAEDATALGVLSQAAKIHGFRVETQDYAGLGVMVVSIAGYHNQGACGWVYEVDGRSGDRSASAYAVKDGETVHWFWSCHNG